ncbi:MAG: hypothetical protein R2707_00870 [Acidimicrobiales bacterium]
MNRFPHPPRRVALLAAGLVLALLATMPGPAAAGFAGNEADSTPARGEHPLRRAISHLPGRVLDLPDTDVALRLHCAPRSTDRRTPAVACEWSGGDDADIGSWQLWRLQVRPAQDSRVLVAEVGVGTTSFLDTGVIAPSAYLYAVLAVDGAGEIVGRSRVATVTLTPPAHEVEPMRLSCAPSRVESDAALTVSVGCAWNPVTAPAAVGYVVWKRTDDGERTVLARVGLSTTAIRDDAVAFGHRYAYLVTAVDGDGHEVGRSRVESVAIPRPDRPAPENTAPDDEAPQRPSEIRRSARPDAD